PTVEHVLQCPGSAAGGILLIACCGEGWAHELTGVAGIGTAFTYPYTAVDRAGDVATVGRERKTIRGHDSISGWAAEVSIQRTQAHDNARIENIVGIEEPFETGHRLERLGTVHSGQEFGAGSSVPVFTGE